MEVNKLVFRMKTTITFGLVQKASLRKAEAALAKQTALCYFSSKSCTCLAAALAKQTALCYFSSKNCTCLAAAHAIFSVFACENIHNLAEG